eukprot:c27914_g1_i1 orf=779-3388(-)
MDTVKQERLYSNEKMDFHTIKRETLASTEAACSNGNASIVVDLSSSSGSDRSIGSGDIGGEVVSPALQSSNGKRSTELGSIGSQSWTTPSRKRSKSSRTNLLHGTSDNLYHTTPDEEEHASDQLQLPVGLFAPLNHSSNGQDFLELPADFLEPLPLEAGLPIDAASIACMSLPIPPVNRALSNGAIRSTDRVCRQFWKAGDYEGNFTSQKSLAGGMDHVRVHPKFLHSNATSHKWALGAVAELLDNALDEVVNGATFVKVDMIENPRDGNPMLLIEDDGGGMNADRMRQCMSLGYSAKSKSANTIGQYGNGFKTSTMRLGADVIVFSRFPERNGCRSTQSIGMLSYSFLRDTGQEDIIVPMVDYELEPFGLKKLIRSNTDDWDRNMETLTQWSPYSTEASLLDQFIGMKYQGTVIVVYNLWEDDQGQLELDFDTDPHDIQVRGANRDEKKIMMAQRFPNSRHFLTYRHSLRSYVSILYLRLPSGFRIRLRGKDVEHHSLVDDLMFTQELTYKPQGGSEQAQRDIGQMMAVVTIGFVKDAKEHIDVQGFNVYHKNRLIKPFWRIWNSASSQGRGIIGVLEANFVEPAHDKQGFERTTVLSRLEARLLQMQKAYWSNHCHYVGYHNNAIKKAGKSGSQAISPIDSRVSDRVVPALPGPREAQSESEVQDPPVVVMRSLRSQTQRIPAKVYQNGATSIRTGIRETEVVESPPSTDATMHDEDMYAVTCRSYDGQPSTTSSKLTPKAAESEKPHSPVNQAAMNDHCSTFDLSRVDQQEKDRSMKFNSLSYQQMEIEENRQLEARIVDIEHQIESMQIEMEKLGRERDSLTEKLLEERKQRELEDEELRKKLKEALLKVRELEAENGRLRFSPC